MSDKRKKSKGSVLAEPQIAYQIGQKLSIEQTSTKSDLEKGELARKGLPKSFALYIQRVLGLTGEQMSQLLAISYRSYQRKKEEDILDPASSQQLIAIIEILDHAKEVFENPNDRVAWFFEPILGLGFQRPIDLLDNAFNQRLVNQALGRLEHGIYG